MGLPGRLEPSMARRAIAGFASAALHLGVIFVVVLSGGRNDGVGSSDAPALQLVLIEAPEAAPAEGIDLTPLEPTVAQATLVEEQLNLSEPPSPAIEAIIEAVAVELEDGQLAPPEAPTEATVAITVESPIPAATFLMSAEEKASLSQRLARLAQDLENAPQTPLEWQENGKQYSARLVRERAIDSTGLERVMAEVSASEHGRKLIAQVMLKRLAFSQFTQVVDRWDPMVQLHDDVIVGRFHTNSRFNVMHDSHTGPKFLGKVTTTARTFEMHSSGRKRHAEIFPGGVETRAGRIDLPNALQPFAWAPQEADARIHQLANDTHIRFFADGSYMWRAAGAPKAEYLNALSEHPVYFIGAIGATLYVQGVVAGKILVYSPHKIVIEDNLTYSRHPRDSPDSRDYLGLVSDKYIEVAPPGVTGPGDLEIHAALFAGRRFVVRDIDHARSATLRIYGSLSAGSLSASEPRYATEIEYDDRFERRRPPGFPLTSRYEAEDWDGHWVETPERMADDPF
jgi:hypothetical protein